MLIFPNCKINLGLLVLGRRADGFHDIETAFYPVPLTDALEMISREANPKPVLHAYGLPIKGNDADNLCIKAWEILKKDFPSLPSVDIHLYKHIPMGAGLGGGSADGAFSLLLLNRKFQLGLSKDQLLAYASQLGSDCPFFIINQPSIGYGRGERLEPCALNLSGYRLVLVHPGIHINTGWAFEKLNRKQTSSTHQATIATLLLEPPNEWRNRLVNDFEEPVFEAYPALKAIKEDLYARGALYASMSGSGSTIFGIFAKTTQPLEPGANWQTIDL